jgi:hypothetical protein
MLKAQTKGSADFVVQWLSDAALEERYSGIDGNGGTAVEDHGSGV